ncbi:unnamed protein product [Rangifer tarandus platyrhynchus]|uniref:Uncharacterized protein n=2 Tax=Rangifer tarandus platyrhynchus TaxID=3082113 RepID=A0ACB0ELH2_RANTA|nr:unnamed protein product [Rangifer tarandus platyrhynchus]CAI9700996.1 unnamed protein product [Rangifer tarandus platyrhynchus]
MPFARVRRRGHTQTRELRAGSFRRPGGGAFRGRDSASAHRNRPMPHQGYSRWPSPLLSTVGLRCPLSFTEVGAYVLKLQHHSEMEKRAAGSVSLISTLCSLCRLPVEETEVQHSCRFPTPFF